MTDRELMEMALEAKSLAGILLREHDNVSQAINYAERMAQRYADSRNRAIEAKHKEKNT